MASNALLLLVGVPENYRLGDVSRGALIDEDALIGAMRAGRIAGADST